MVVYIVTTHKGCVVTLYSSTVTVSMYIRRCKHVQLASKRVLILSVYTEVCKQE